VGNGQPERLRRGPMVEDRRALEQQAQRLPIDGEQGLGGHPGETEQIAMHGAAAKRLAFQAEGGVEQLQFALPVLHVHADAPARRVEAHAVLQGLRQERRDVEGLGHAAAQIAVAVGRQYVVITLTPGRVAHLAEHRGELLLFIEAIEETDRVEAQAPAARLGQQAHRAGDRSTQRFAHALAHGIGQCDALSGVLRQVVALAEGEGGEAPTATQR